MAARLLGREQDAADDEDRDDQGGADAAEVESAVANGFVSRSPIVAPSGRVRMNANQNIKVREMRFRTSWP